VAELDGAHPSWQDRILLNYTRIENLRKVLKKTLNFPLCKEVGNVANAVSACDDQPQQTK